MGKNEFVAIDAFSVRAVAEVPVRAPICKTPMVN
jgi:hypothetical protein